MPVPVRVRLMLPQSVGGKLETLHRVAVLLAMLLLNACAAIGSVPIADAQDGIPTLAPMIEKVLPGIVSVTAQGLRSKEEMTLLADPLFRRRRCPERKEGRSGRRCRAATKRDQPSVAPAVAWQSQFRVHRSRRSIVAVCPYCLAGGVSGGSIRTCVEKLQSRPWSE